MTPPNFRSQAKCGPLCAKVGPLGPFFEGWFYLPILHPIDKITFFRKQLQTTWVSAPSCVKSGTIVEVTLTLSNF